MEHLPEDEVHVWLRELPPSPSPGVLAAAEALLSSAERERAARFRFDRQRDAYFLSHALVRTTLSRYAAVAPEAWEFVTEEGGRPRLAGPAGAPALRFNLSHGEELAACAVAAEVAVGVDVEAAARVRQPLEIAERYFAREEVAAIAAREGAARLACFLEHWTLKEAYLKARGEGLALPLDRVRFAPAGPRVEVAFDPELEDDPAHWQFALSEPAPGQRLAVAVQRPGREDLTVRLRWDRC